MAIHKTERVYARTKLQFCTCMHSFSLVYSSRFALLYIYLLFFHGFIFLLWTSAVRHSELRQVIRLWWRCSQAGWHLLSVTHRDSEGSKQITFSHLRQHVKLHLIVRCRRLIHDNLQEERFVTDQWNIYRITESAAESCIHWDRLLWSIVELISLK